MSPTEPILTVQDLQVCFGGQCVLKGLNLQIRTGELVMVVGPSGSGKTTLLRAINRLNEEYPDCRTQGRIALRLGERWFDCQAGELPLTELRLRAGLVFQHPNLLPFSVYKNVALPLRVSRGVPPAEVEERVQRALKDVRLWDEVKDRMQESALTLSGGQQQRLCLARVLALEPSILLLDEPTASLDFRATLQIEELFRSLKERYATLAVTHSLGQMRRLADRVLVMSNGELVQELAAPELADPERCQRIMERIF